MDTKQIVYEMLLENTGIWLMDSGGVNNRHWQKNQWKTLPDFENEPQILIENNASYYTIIISVFHYLTQEEMEIDGLCAWYNQEIIQQEWDCSEFYGVNESQKIRLEDNGFYTAISSEKHHYFNSYDWDTELSQTIQWTILQNDNGKQYVLLQIHGGCDIRGGYTQARLFRLAYGCLPSRNIQGTYKEKEIYNQGRGSMFYDMKNDEKIEMITKEATLKMRLKPPCN